MYGYVVWCAAFVCTLSCLNLYWTRDNKLSYLILSVCKKKYPASLGQHILLFLVSFERYMKNAINEGLFIKFHVCVSKLQIFKKSQEFFWQFLGNVTIDVNGNVSFSKFR